MDMEKTNLPLQKGYPTIMAAVMAACKCKEKSTDLRMVTCPACVHKRRPELFPLTKYIHICKTDKTSIECEKYFCELVNSDPDRMRSASEWIEVELYGSQYPHAPCGGTTTRIS